MNCKPGDLARVIAPGFLIACSCGHRQAVVKPDTFVVCGEAHADGWKLQEPIRVGGQMQCDGGFFSGRVNSLPDAILRPIRPQADDAVDEMVHLVGAAPKTLTEVREVVS